MARIYIGLCGKAQHGKSTLAAALRDYYGPHHATCTAFAQKPKQMLATMGLRHDQLYGDNKHTPTSTLGGHTPRHAMQTLATDWGRQMLYDEVWVDAWDRTQRALRAEVIIVEDVRHLPEVDRLRQKNAFLVEVYRPDLMPSTRLGWVKHWWSQRTQHPSEKLDFAKLQIPRLINTDPTKLLEGLFLLHPDLKDRKAILQQP